MGWFFNLLADSRLGWKWLIVANTLTYSTTELITAVKGFIVKASGANLIKIVTND
jgi:hypothetical protein